MVEKKRIIVPQSILPNIEDNKTEDDWQTFILSNEFKMAYEQNPVSKIWKMVFSKKITVLL